MGIVTLTGHLGSMGNVGTLVAQELGYRLIGREIVEEAARALGWTEEEARPFDENVGGVGRWLSDFIERIGAQSVTAGDVVGAYAVPYADAVSTVGASSDQYIDTLRNVLRAFADQGDVVLVGRGGQALFADRPDAVHIRVACPAPERARRIALRDGVDLATATATVEESDRQREAWHTKYFEIDYRSPYHYSLVVNTGQLDDVFAAHTIVEVARHQFARAAM